jgi:hypothetical protein
MDQGQAGRVAEATDVDPRRGQFLDYVRVEALALPEPAWDIFRQEVFGVLTSCRQKALAQVV